MRQKDGLRVARGKGRIYITPPIYPMYPICPLIYPHICIHTLRIHNLVELILISNTNPTYPICPLIYIDNTHVESAPDGFMFLKLKIGCSPN